MLKYRPDFPDRFGSLQDSRSFCQTFFAWYNEEHRHSGIALLTPAMLHYGQAPAILDQRQGVLMAAYHAHPERFVRRNPSVSPRRCGSTSQKTTTVSKLPTGVS